MKLNAVPLCVPVARAKRAGSGFFLWYASREWLVTAGHLPLLLRQPHARWLEWPQTLEIALSAFGGKSFRLMRKVGVATDPAFAYLGGGDEPLADFLALPVPAGTAITAGARLFQLVSAVPKPGAPATVVGYPTNVDPWPALAPIEIPVTVCSITPEIMFYEPAAPEGTSGGPILSKDGELLGMSIGFDEAGKAVTAFAIREILEANLTSGRFGPIPGFEM